MKLNLKPVQDQVVVLLGASSGIGRLCPLRFAERGAKVVVCARSGPGLDSLVAQIRANGGEATAAVTDVSDLAQVQAVADRAIEAYGRIDTWVNLAAVIVFAPFEHTTVEEFKRVIDVNLMGQVHGAMAALPHLKRDGGAPDLCVLDGSQAIHPTADGVLLLQARHRRLHRSPAGRTPARQDSGEPD